MKRARVLAGLLVPLLLGLPGCDVAVGVYFATKKKSSKSSSAPSAPAPDPRYLVYGATLTAGTESTERNNIKAAGGNPGPNWTLIDGGTATKDYALSTGMNAVLIQTTTVQDYDIDAVEGHDVALNVVSTFTTTNFGDQLTNPSNIAGFPDGVPVLAKASATQKAFIFQILPASATAVVSVRVFIVAHLGTRASGDANWVTPWSRGGDQTPGGAAANSIGTVFFGATDVGTQAQWVLAVDANGNLQTGASAILTLESGTAVSVGNISLAVDPNDNLVIANVSTSSLAAGNSAIRWRKLQPTTAIPPVWTNPSIWDQNFAGPGINLVGSNAVVLDSSHNVIIAGGNDVGISSSKNGRWMRKVTGGGGGEIWTQTGPTDLSSTWWRGVAIGPADGIATTGDITTGVAGPIEVFARTTNTGNTSTSDADYPESGTPADLGEATAVDGSGNTYVGGFLGISGPSKNAVILKIPSGTTTPAPWFLETANAPSEILGLLSVPDGTLYALGYETVASQSPVSTQTQGKNIVVLKIDPAGNVLWKRTYDSGQGDDLAVSATLTPTSLVVVGQVSTASNGKDVFVLSYAR